MNELVIKSQQGQDVTTSLIVAEVFGKRHDHVLRDIENLSCSERFRVANFGETPYTHPQNGQTYRAYQMTKDGFSFLVMGYTGKKAGEFKEMFINEFNKREMMLKDDDYILARSQEILHNRLTQAQKQLEQQKLQLQAQEIEINSLRKGNEYLNTILNSKGTVTVSQIAQDYGFSARNFNKKLNEMRIHHKVNGQWVLYAPYLGKGYVQSKTIVFTHSDGRPDTRMNTEWTQKGRLFLYDALKESGIYPLIEVQAAR